MALKGKRIQPVLTAGKYCQRVSPASDFFADWLKNVARDFNGANYNAKHMHAAQRREKLLLSLID